MKFKVNAKHIFIKSQIKIKESLLKSWFNLNQANLDLYAVGIKSLVGLTGLCNYISKIKISIKKLENA